MEQKIYQIVNVIILLMALHMTLSLGYVWDTISSDSVIIVTVVSVLVSIIKAIRLYLILYGTGIDRKIFFRQYCKVIPVSVVFPFKLGDVFKIFCFGFHIKNYMYSMCAIILDRFADTLALMTLLCSMVFFSVNKTGYIFYLLMIFLIGIIILYWLFPGLNNYWRHYCLCADATKNKIKLLQFLSKLELSYNEINKILEGKTIVLYILSLLAWGIESLGLVIFVDYGGIGEAVSQHLISALSGTTTMYIEIYTVSCTFIALSLYFIIEIVFRMTREIK